MNYKELDKRTLIIQTNLQPCILYKFANFMISSFMNLQEANNINWQVEYAMRQCLACLEHCFSQSLFAVIKQLGMLNASMSNKNGKLTRNRVGTKGKVRIAITTRLIPQQHFLHPFHIRSTWQCTHSTKLWINKQDQAPTLVHHMY